MTGEERELDLHLADALDEVSKLKTKLEYYQGFADLYEELRSLIDGGSESMTHKDACAEIRALQERADPYYQR
jgi:hypothetical protein